MQYRRFGRTELQMPVLTCGGMRYQHDWKDSSFDEIPSESQHNLRATVRKGIESGMIHIETARGYGTSEVQLSRVLSEFPRKDLIVQTKVPPREDPQEFLKACEQSLETLQLDYVDLLGMHGVNAEEVLDHAIRPGGCWEVAKKLQEQGKVRHIGFSTHAPTDVIVRAIESGLFDYVNLHWYYIFQTNWAAIEAAAKQDMGVFIISPNDKGGKLYSPSQKLMDLCQPLSPMVFNDLFCLSHPQVHTLSIGASRPTDYDEHLKAVELLDQTDKLLPPILEKLETEAIAQLGEEWHHTWHVGLPRHQDTPGGVNIPIILLLRNLAVAYDMMEYGQMRYNMLGNGGHWFPGYRADKVADLDLGECLANSPHADQIPTILQEAHDLLSSQDVKRLSQS